MRAINHALTGAVIGLVVTPIIALPAAIVSHYVLDAVPHYDNPKTLLGSRRFVIELVLDASLCAGLVALLAINTPFHWGWAIGTAFLAAAPDFMWITSFLSSRSNRPQPQYHNPLVKLHQRVQWFERPIGAVVEIVWAIAMLTTLSQLI